METRRAVGKILDAQPLQHFIGNVPATVAPKAGRVGKDDAALSCANLDQDASGWRVIRPWTKLNF